MSSLVAILARVEQPLTRNPGRQDTAAVSDGPTAVAAARSHSDGSGVVVGNMTQDPRQRGSSGGADPKGVAAPGSCPSSAKSSREISILFE